MSRPNWFLKKHKANKYGNIETELHGISFMSQGEANCYAYLKLLEQAGEIRDIETQVTVRLTRAEIRYIMDFRFFDIQKNKVFYADFKGFETERWAILKKLWPYYGPAPLIIYKSFRNREISIAEIIHNGKTQQINLDGSVTD